MVNLLTIVCLLSGLTLVGCGVVFAVNDLRDLAVLSLTIGVFTLAFVGLLYPDRNK